MISGDNMRKINNNKGFTLIEILLSMTILSIIIVPLSTFFLTSQKISKDSEINFEAMTIAQNYFEKIKAIDNFDWIGEFDQAEEINNVINEGNYKIEITIKPENDFKNKGTSNNINTIDYDMKLQVINNIVKIYDSKTNTPFTLLSNTIDIIFDNNSISTSPSSLSINELDKEKINFRIDLTDDINLNVFNKSNNNQTLVFYIIKEKDSNVIYSFNVEEGKVKKYDNIYFDDTQQSLSYILYDVTLKVYYKNKFITEMNGYKSIY